MIPIVFNKDLFLEVRPPPKVQMRSLSKSILPLLFVALGSPLSPLVSIPIFHNSSYEIDDLSETVGNLTANRPTCTASFGDDLSEESCRNAWDKIDRFSTKVQRFVPRQHAAIDDVPMPFRYLSDDGTCAIDIRFRRPSKGDFNTGVEISADAKRIIHQCVLPHKKGGSVASFSE